MSSSTGLTEADPALVRSSSLKDGLNFRVTQGKHSNSKIIIQEPFSFVVEKFDSSRATGDSIVYVKCRYASCPARAVIKNNFLEVKNPDRNGHTCPRTDGAGLNKIRVDELKNKMKKRAMSEGTSFYVSD